MPRPHNTGLPLRSAGAHAVATAAALLLVAACSAPPQSARPLAGFQLRKCGEPSQPLGILRGQGIVRYMLDASGRPDTATLAVLQVSDLSIAEYRSAVTRELSACRMRVPGDRLPAPVRVAQRVAFDSVSLQVAPALPGADSLAPAMTEPANYMLPPGPYASRDPVLEERPRKMGCSLDIYRGEAPPQGPFPNRAAAEAALADWRRRNSGTVSLRMEIAADGTVPRDSITVTSTDNPMVADRLLASVTSCRYAPARIHGVPVAVVGSAVVGVRQVLRFF